MIATPDTDVPQWTRAMARADMIRTRRARLRRHVAAEPRPAGFLRICELLEDPPEEIATLEALALLCWVHRVGRSYGRSILLHADEIGGPITENAHVGDLTERRRRALARHLREIYAGTSVPSGSWR